MCDLTQGLTAKDIKKITWWGGGRIIPLDIPFPLRRHAHVRPPSASPVSTVSPQLAALASGAVGIRPGGNRASLRRAAFPRPLLWYHEHWEKAV